jgi:hypothetical protein
MFQTAVKDAPADGPLRKLVEEELALLAKGEVTSWRKKGENNPGNSP